MKQILLVFLMWTFSLVAEETNVIKITVTTTFTVVQSSNVFTTLPEPPTSVVITTNFMSNPTKLLGEIRQVEKYLSELTNGVPIAYAGWSDAGSSNVINYYSNIWYSYRVNLTNLLMLKEDFKQIIK